jgi:hypothetical protein
MVGYLAVTKADVLADVAEPRVERGGLWQSVVVVGLLLAIGVSGCLWQTSALQADGATTTNTAAAGAAPGGTVGQAAGAHSPRTRLGDLSAFRVITQDTLQRVDAGNQSAALARVRDLEIAWDDAEAQLKPRDKAAWTDLDGKIDKVLESVSKLSVVFALEALVCAMRVRGWCAGRVGGGVRAARSASGRAAAAVVGRCAGPGVGSGRDPGGRVGDRDAGTDGRAGGTRVGRGRRTLGSGPGPGGGP